MSKRGARRARKRSVNQRNHSRPQNQNKPAKDSQKSAKDSQRPAKDSQKAHTLWGLTPNRLGAGLVGALAIILPSLLLPWQPLAALGLALFAIGLVILLIALFKGHGRKALAFALPFLVIALGYGIGTAGQWYEERPDRAPVHEACEDIRRPVVALTAMVLSSAASHVAKAQYSGQAWTSVLGSLSEFQVQSLRAGDTQLTNAADAWLLNWSSLTNSPIQVNGHPDPPVQGQYFSNGFLAEIKALRRCEELGFPQSERTTSGKDVCRSLLNFAVMLPGGALRSDWTVGAYKVIAMAEGNGLKYAALKYEAANFALLTMNGYIATNGYLYPKSAVVFESLQGGCASVGVTLPSLPSTGTS